MKAPVGVYLTHHCWPPGHLAMSEVMVSDYQWGVGCVLLYTEARSVVEHPTMQGYSHRKKIISNPNNRADSGNMSGENFMLF